MVTRVLSTLCVLALWAVQAGAESRYMSDPVSAPATGPSVPGHLLDTPIEVTFPSGVMQVGAAMRVVLADIGYGLGAAQDKAPALKRLLAMSLPRVHRTLGPTSIRAALATLAGPAYRLRVDDVQRMVTFEVGVTEAAAAERLVPVLASLPPPRIDAVKTYALPEPVKVVAQPVVETVPTPRTYGPVRPGDTLLAIARALSGDDDDGITMAQVMLAILDEQPAVFEVFDKPNVNFIKRGATISAPSRENVLKRSPAQAAAELQAHYAAFRKVNGDAPARVGPKVAALGQRVP